MRTVEEITKEAFRLHMDGKLYEAEQVYDQLLCQLPSPDVNVLMGYGTLLVSQQKYGLGIALLQTAASIYDKSALIWVNLGAACKQIGKDTEAMSAYSKALALDPELPEVLSGLAGFWVNKGEPKKVEYWAKKALAIDLKEPSANMHMALGLLEQRRFDEAWPYYEYRWETVDRIKNKRPYICPRWDGSRVRKLSIHGEQGLGDEILFMSMFHLAKAKVDSVVVECADRLVELFEESFGVKCYPNHQALIAGEGEPDAYIAMASLPALVGLPDGNPFLKRIGSIQHTKPRIGICWRGGTHKTNTKDRTIGLPMMKPIFDALDADFVSLQYGHDDVDKEAAEFGLTVGHRDFVSLQRRIASCDLVITVCQTAVHQAGAMGVPCWVLTPRHAAWRYCGENMRPWYNSVRLFKQSSNLQWEPVIERIASELHQNFAERAA